MKTVTFDENEWQLVPKEPTRVMLDEAHCDLDRSGEIDPMVKLVYMNMLYKAPQPPVVEVEPVAYLKTWSSVGNAVIDRCRVDLTPDCEPWLENMFPKVAPLYPSTPDTEALRQRIAELLRMLTEQDYEYNRNTNDLIKRHTKQLAAQAEQIKVAREALSLIANDGGNRMQYEAVCALAKLGEQ